MNELNYLPSADFTDFFVIQKEKVIPRAYNFHRVGFFGGSLRGEGFTPVFTSLFKNLLYILIIKQVTVLTPCIEFYEVESFILSCNFELYTWQNSFWFNINHVKSDFQMSKTI